MLAVVLTVCLHCGMAGENSGDCSGGEKRGTYIVER